MTEEEKSWLSQFIAETDHGNFRKSSRLKVEEKALRILRSEYRKLKKTGNVEEMSLLYPKIELQYQLVLRLREEDNSFYVTDEERHELFDRDYERRMDVFNNAKITDSLVMYDINEYDKFSTEAEKDINPEDICFDRLKVKRKEKK